MQEFTGIIRHFPVTKRNCLLLCWKRCPVAQTVGLQSAAATGLGLGRKAGRQAGFLPLALPLLLLKVPSMEVNGGFSN